jgi:hypothetical protein
MKNLMKAVAATVLFALPAAGFACDYPERPTMPDGSTAPKEDMIAAQSAVKAFLAAVDEYLICIEQEEKDATDAMPEVDESDEEAVKLREEEIKRRDQLPKRRSNVAINFFRNASMRRMRKNSCSVNNGTSRSAPTTRVSPDRARSSRYQRYF